MDQPIATLSLDDLYKMTADIYGDRNSVRSKESTLAHFVEVCGMLTIADRKKKREAVDFADTLCRVVLSTIGEDAGEERGDVCKNHD